MELNAGFYKHNGGTVMNIDETDKIEIKKAYVTLVNKQVYPEVVDNKIIIVNKDKTTRANLKNFAENNSFKYEVKENKIVLTYDFMIGISKTWDELDWI